MNGPHEPQHGLPSTDDAALLRIRVETLFTFDKKGRMLRSNELDGVAPPLIFLGQTGSSRLLRFGGSLPDTAARELETLVDSAPPPTGLVIPKTLRDGVGRVLARYSLVTEETGGPAFRFPESVSRPPHVVAITPETSALLHETFPWLERELPYWAPAFGVVQDGAVVSVCFSSRIAAEACEAGLETLTAYRGRGYAVAVTNAWGAAVRASGRTPIYSTFWSNHASQSVARRAGLILFSVDSTWR